MAVGARLYTTHTYTVYSVHVHQCSVIGFTQGRMMTSPSMQWRKKITPNSLPDSERHSGAGVALGLSKLLQLMPHSTNTSVNEKWGIRMQMGNKNRKWKRNGQMRMDRWEWGRTWAQFWGGCSQRLPRSCSVVWPPSPPSCTAPDENGCPQPQGTWGPEEGGEGEWNGWTGYGNETQEETYHLL